MRYTSGPTSRKSLLTAFLLIAVFVGIGFRFVDLGGNSLWTDEMLTVDNALIGEEVTASDIFGNIQGPLVTLLVRFWGGISMEEGFLRFPFAVAGGLTVGVIYLLSRYVSGPWVSLNVTFFASLSPMLLWYSQELRGYVFVVLFTVLMTYYLVRWVDSRSNRHLFLYGLFAFAGLLSNLSAVFVILAHFMYLLASPAKRRMLGRYILALLVVLLFFSPWVRSILIRTHVDRLVTADTGEPLRGGARWSGLALPYTFFTYAVGYTLGPSLNGIRMRGLAAVMENLHWVIGAGAVFTATALVGLKKLRQKNGDLLFLLLVWLVVPIVAVAVLSMRNVKVFTPRYAMVSVPPFAFIVGRGIAAITRSRWWPVTLVITGLLAVSIGNYFLDPAYGKDDARGVAATIRKHYESSDEVAALYATRPLAHYLEGFADVHTFGADDMESGRTIESRCREIASGADRVWLILCREWLVDPDDVIRNWFDENMMLLRSFEFTGMRLRLYAKRGG